MPFRRILILSIFILLSSCKKETLDLQYETIALPLDMPARAVGIENGKWLISGGRGENGFILESKDDLKSIQIITDSLYYPVYDQIFIDSTKRYIFSCTENEIYFSNQWFSNFWIYYPPEDYWVNTLNKTTLRQVLSTPGMGLYMAGGDGLSKGLIHHSPNRGKDWVPYEVDNEMRGLAFQPPHTVWACGYGLVIKTKNFDAGWENVPFANGFFTDIDFADNNTGIISTFSGKIYRTTDGGNNWNEVFSTGRMKPGLSINKIRFLGEGKAIAIGNGGFIAKSNDYGASWEWGISFGENDLYDVAFENFKLYLVGKNPVIYVSEW